MRALLLVDNGRRNATGLGDFLHERNVTDVFVIGLATYYCVKFTVLDALELGFQVRLIEDGCRGVDLTPGDSERAVRNMCQTGANVVQCDEIT